MIKFGVRYFLSIFLIGILFGFLRALVLEPTMGPVKATLIEVPPILLLSWYVAGKLQETLPLKQTEALWSGLGALALLWIAEMAFALIFFNYAIYLDRLLSVQGLIGIVAQVVFGLIPWLKLRINCPL